jgi:hypothetical protein
MMPVLRHLLRRMTMLVRILAVVTVAGMVAHAAPEAAPTELSDSLIPAEGRTLFEVLDPSVQNQFIAPFSEGCHSCDELCSNDEVQRHATEDDPQGGWELRTPTAHPAIHSCSGVSSQGECFVDHQEFCTPTLAGLIPESRESHPIHDLVNELLAEDFSRVVELASLNPDHIRLSHERHALQILGCDGNVFAHIPLSRAVTIQ